MARATEHSLLAIRLRLCLAIGSPGNYEAQVNAGSGGLAVAMPNAEIAVGIFRRRALRLASIRNRGQSASNSLCEECLLGWKVSIKGAMRQTSTSAP
jgi:hypothetical protein